MKRSHHVSAHLTRMILRALAAATLLAFIPYDGPGQTTARTPAGVDYDDSLVTMTNRLDQKRVERIRLHRMLNALNEIDSVYKSRYPTWVVLDEDLKERIHRLFRLRNPEVPADGEVTVIASPEYDELVELSTGEQHFGRVDSRTLLSDSLVEEILSGTYQRRMVEVTTERPRYNVLSERPKYAAVSLSAFGGMVLFKGGFGLEARLGHEEIGYHFWSTGDFHVNALIDQLKIGVIVPFTYGNGLTQLRQPLSVLPRKLTGVTGVTAEYELPMGADLASAKVSVGEPVADKIATEAADPSNAYVLHTSIQETFSHQEAFGGEEHLFTFTGGLGFHQVTNVAVVKGDLVSLGKENFFSPVLRVEYVHQGGRLYGLGLQYYSSIMYATCWVEFIKNFLFLDLKYYSPVFRHERPWEQTYFFMVSPRLQIVY